MKHFSISITEAEEAVILERQADMQRMFHGIKVSKSDACKSLMMSDRKHEARLHDVMLHVITNDIAEALHSLGWKGDKISSVLEGVYAAHPESRRLHLPPAKTEDIAGKRA